MTFLAPGFGTVAYELSDRLKRNLVDLGSLFLMWIEGWMQTQCLKMYGLDCCSYLIKCSEAI